LPKQSLTKKFFAGVNVFCIDGMSSFPCLLPLKLRRELPNHFSSPKKCSINQVPIMPARKMASRNNMVMQIVRRMVIVHLKENHQD
jgi:hypothetical protein